MSRPVRYLIIALILISVISVYMITQVAYRVDLKGEISEITGEPLLISAQNREIPLEKDREFPLEPNQQLQLNDGDSMRIELMQDSQAFAYLIDIGVWEILTSERKGTVIDHIQGKGKEHKLVIQHLHGVALYDFSDADPPRRDIEIEIELLDSVIVPSWDCFQVDGAAQEAFEVPCWDTEVQPVVAPSLPELPD